MRSFTALVIVVTLIHVAAFVVVVLIRLWPDRPAAASGQSVQIRPCTVCGEPSTHLGYDGLDPGEQRDPHTGRAYSMDMAHYQPLCAAHGPATSLAAAQGPGRARVR